MKIKFALSSLFTALLMTPSMAAADDHKSYIFGEPVIFEFGATISDVSVGDIKNLRSPSIDWPFAPDVKTDFVDCRFNPCLFDSIWRTGFSAQLTNLSTTPKPFGNSKGMFFGIRGEVDDKTEANIRLNWARYGSSGEPVNYDLNAITSMMREGYIPETQNQILPGSGLFGFDANEVYGLDINVSRDLFSSIDLGGPKIQPYVLAGISLVYSDAVNLRLEGEFPDFTELPVFTTSLRGRVVQNFLLADPYPMQTGVAITPITDSGFFPRASFGGGLEMALSDESAIALEYQRQYMTLSGKRDIKITENKFGLRLSRKF